jgi:tartrate-resistant acid phosphatase type 5
MKLRLLAFFVLLGPMEWGGAPLHSASLTTCAVRFAVIGDYGANTAAEADVAALVKSWKPAVIITTGDNNYPSGAANAIDTNIGQYYSEYIFPYTGVYTQPTTSANRFFPVLGNHDWLTANAQPYLDYFALPGNERYYTFTVGGLVDFFMLDSDGNEPSGVISTSIQAQWLQASLAASAAPWKLVVMHHSAYSSGMHGSLTYMRWPFAAWGASAALAGHDHLYERIVQNGFPYFVNGAGGQSLYKFGTPVGGSAARYNADYGAMLVTASAKRLTFQFINRRGQTMDTFSLNRTDTSSCRYWSLPPRRR